MYFEHYVVTHGLCSSIKKQTLIFPNIIKSCRLFSVAETIEISLRVPFLSPTNTHLRQLDYFNDSVKEVLFIHAKDYCMLQWMIVHKQKGASLVIGPKHC